LEHGWTHEHIRISIHAPLAGRDLGCNSWTEYRDISIHAPLAGRDARSREWEAANRISIHAPLAGRDAAKAAGIYGTRNFNPRAPCGARLPPLAAPPCYTGFQSTRPLRGATFPPIAAQVASGISIHAPLAGRDGGGVRQSFYSNDFNPRAPCGARHCFAVYHCFLYGYFNPRAPCGARLSV